MNLEKIYNENFDRIYKFFYYKSVNKSEIADLVHDVFLRFYDKYKDTNFDNIRYSKILYLFSSYIYKEWVRAQIKMNKTEFNEDLLPSVDETNDFIEDYEIKLESRKSEVLECIEKLNPNVRDVIKYRFFDNMTRAQTAIAMGISEDSVHKYQSRGVSYIKKMLKT